MTEEKIDLSRISKVTLSEIKSVLKAIYRGTPVAFFIGIGGFVLGHLTSIPSMNYFFDSNPQSKNAVTTNQPVSGAQPSDPVRVGANSYEQKEGQPDTSLVGKIKDLQSKVDSLTEQLNNLPDELRCMNYDSEIKTLRANKQEIENRIQVLLYPPQTKEQVEIATYYSTAELEVFTKQAAEYRKQATDIQEQIKAVELDRVKCK
jgi:hypothetical protein